MLDKPDAAELLEAIAAFLAETVVPSFEGRKRFHALVAANVARILAREVRLGPQRIDDEARSLWALLGREGVAPEHADVRLVRDLTEELCARIDSGDADDGPWREKVLAYLKQSIGRRLDIDNPDLPR